MARNDSNNPDGGSNAAASPVSAGRQKILFGTVNDGNIDVIFSEKDLEVWADIIPPTGSGQYLSANNVGTILQKLNINYGIQWDEIQKALEKCNTERRMVRDVILARGDAPVNEISEYFEINPVFTQTTRQKKESDIVDHREYSPFTIVKKGQTLAKLIPRRPGADGKNIHGDILPFEVIRRAGLSGGANTRTEEKLIVSEIDGQLIETKKVLDVQETLVIKGPVGYGTGNIVFPGDVNIEGPVSDGFSIVSGGSVVIKQTFDVTRAVTKGDLVVAGGIIGRGVALLKAGGGIRTKFIENCKAAARKSIVVDSGITNSSIFTLDRIEMGDKGMILGGDIYAVRGLKTGGIGKKAGKSTHIHCGIDFTVQQEKEKTNNKLSILNAKLAKLKEYMAGPADESSQERQVKMEELLRRLEGELQAATTHLNELLGRINSDTKAAVEVSGEIAPGTLIEICQIALYVTDPLRKVRIRLEDDGSKLVTEPL